MRPGDDTHRGVLRRGRGVAEHHARAVVLRFGKVLQRRGVPGIAVALDQREDWRTQRVRGPVAQLLGFRQRGEHVGVETLGGRQFVGFGRSLESDQTADFAVRRLEQGHGSGGVVLVECVGEGLALGIARQPELRSVARLGVELLDVAVEVRVVLRRDAQRLQVGELAQRIRLAQLELVVARHFLRTQRHHAEAAVRHRGHLSQCAVGVVDSYSR